MKKRVMLKIGVTVEDPGLEKTDFDKIGEFLAQDLFRIYYNGEDFLKTDYLGCEKVENP